MATTFERANKAIEAMVQHALEKYHPDLHKEGVTIDCTIVRRIVDDEDAHALKRSGYPIDGKIGITALQDRARGIADAKLTIDGYEWNKATDHQRLALIDHELEHLVLVLNKPTKKNNFDDSPKRDDLHRPMLKVRPHDWMISGFKTVAERHGVHSHEAMHFAAFRAEFAQLNFFGPPDVLAIANGKKEKPDKKLKEMVRKVLTPGGGIDKVTISSKINGKEVSVSSDDLKDISTRCARRHHKDCNYSGCQCNCHHAQKETHANG